MFCPSCGRENPDQARFCVQCGRTLEGQAVVSPAQPSSSVQETSGKAIGSLICGLLFFIFPASVAAIIMGHLALSDIRKSAGRLKGHGMAVAGLALGYAGAAFIPFVLIIAAIAIPNLLRARMAANEASAADNLRTIDAAAITYQSTYANGYPISLQVLSGPGQDPGTCDQAGLIDNTLAGGRRTGYIFIYTPEPPASGTQPALSSEASAQGCTSPGATAYTVNADPITTGTTGQRSFFTDQTGVIRYSSDGEATADSPPLE